MDGNVEDEDLWRSEIKMVLVSIKGCGSHL